MHNTIWATLNVSVKNVHSRSAPVWMLRAFRVTAVANMFMVPLGIACGGGITFSHFLASNLLPVTLGNIVGGVFGVALPYALVYGQKKGAH